MLEKASSPENVWALKQAPQGTGHGPKLMTSMSIWTTLSEMWSQFYDSMNFGWSCVDSGAGLGHPCQSLPTRDILSFHDSTSGSCLIQLVGNVAPKFSYHV